MLSLPPILENAVEAFAQLPGVGKKTALRYVLHLLRESNETAQQLVENTQRLLDEITHCRICHNISEQEICEICDNPKRDQTIICVVESMKEVITVESTSQFKGVYHVLGGLISPMDGIGPNDLTIGSLVERMQEGNVNEVILALSTTMEGDTTAFYLSKQLKDYSIMLSVLARGIAVGGELEYADEVTLGRSLVERVPYEVAL